MIKYFCLFVFSISFSQQTKSVNFKTVLGKIAINPSTKTVSGEIFYDFEVLNPTDTIKIDAQNMTFSEVFFNGKTVNYLTTKKEIKVIYPFKKGKNKLHFKYNCKPSQAIYFVGESEKLQIWTQGQGKYTSHWFPSFDDVNEKVIFNLDISFGKNYEVISNGTLQSKTESSKNFVWSYRMKQPMSSYLLMLTIGKFDKKTEISTSGIPLEMYIQSEDLNKFEPTYRYSKQIFDFLEFEIGVNYPWEIYKQIPIRDFLYAGMENTSATLFSQDFVVDSVGFNDKNYINVNAHELAHQWFGDLITAKSGKDHWLQEGFATYYALLAEQNVFGSDYFNWKMYEMAERLQQASKTDTIPILNEKASSLTFYQKGAWALHYLKENIGDSNFKTAVKNYLNKYKFKNVTTDDFLAEINKVCDFDTIKFRKDWLESPIFEVQQTIKILQKNSMIQNYFEIAEMKDLPLTQKQNQFEKVKKSDAYYPIKQEIIYQLQANSFAEKESLIRLAMESDDVNVRQSVAASFKVIPEEFKLEYLTFLEDKSYITNEIALNNLWKNFPNEQINLLEKTKHWIGFNDKNLRILWLTLALKTNNFEADKKVIYYQELLDYASPLFESIIRQNALTNLIYLDKNDENYLPFLINGLTSHKWQMVKFCKDKIREFLKNKRHRDYFEITISKIPALEQIQLEKLLKEK
jgi:aminopeptidase N